MNKVSLAAAQAEADGFTEAIFVGMGSSNLAAEAVRQLMPENRWKRVMVLDSIDPASIRRAEELLVSPHTLVIYANKSGTKIETHSLLLHLLQKAKAAGRSSPGEQFIAVAEEDAYLTSIAVEYRFRALFKDPPGISGLYSGLIHYGLLLAAFCRTEPKAFAASAIEMRQACGQDTPPERNPALHLASLLAAGEESGHHRLILWGSERLKSFTHSIAQCVGVSTCKDGKGIVPLSGDFPFVPQAFEQGCIAALFRMKGDPDEKFDEISGLLRKARVPTISIEIGALEQLGAAIFKWEIAAALTCSAIGVEPFYEPDVRDGRERTQEILDYLTAKHAQAMTTVRAREATLELYAEGTTRREISTLNLKSALKSFFELRKSDGYMAILAFVDRSPELTDALQKIREQIMEALHIPVLLSFGPRYLHSSVQMYRGGVAKGIFLIVTTKVSDDISVPGTTHTFGQLGIALAQGDFETLERRGRRALRVQLAEGAETGLNDLQSVLGQALSLMR